MKIAVCGDVHYCVNSSVIRSRGEKYSTRIENCIKSINWFEQEITTKCDLVVYLGDFFDSPVLNDEIITSLKDIEWNKSLVHFFLVGNHESSVGSLEYNSAKDLESDQFKIISEPFYFGICGLFFLPYITEDNRRSLQEYVKDIRPRILFSHNDLKGVQMGAITSKTGFDLEDILSNSDLYVNGHIHNGSWVIKDRILNLGNLTGQNFGEDGYVYNHNVAIIDTDTLNVEFIKNPYAFNFYKFEVNTIDEFNAYMNKIKNKPSSIVSVKCNENILKDVNQELKKSNLVCSKVISFSNNNYTTTECVDDFTVDHLDEFKKFCLVNIGNNDTVISELNEVCR